MINGRSAYCSGTRSFLIALFAFMRLGMKSQGFAEKSAALLSLYQ